MKKDIYSNEKDKEVLKNDIIINNHLRKEKKKKEKIRKKKEEDEKNLLNKGIANKDFIIISSDYKDVPIKL